MSDDRSERLRRRRKRASDEAVTEGGKADRSRQETEPNRDASDSIKDRQTGTYMYLPDTQVKDLRRIYNILKAEYEYQYGETFEKNRHFYPLVVRYGLNHLRDLDAEEVHARLEELP